MGRGSELDDGWSDDDAPADDWDDAPKPAARRAKKPVDDAEPAVQVRSTRRRPARDADEREPEPERAKPAASAASDDLLGLGLWDETPAQPAKSAKEPAKAAKASRKPAEDDWGFDEDAPKPAARRAKKVSIDDLFEDAEEAEAEPAAPAPRRAKKPSLDDLFDDEDEAAAPRAAPRRAKKAAVDDLFDDEDAPKAAPRRARKPTTDDWDDEPKPRAAPRRAKKPAVDDLFDDEPAAAPAPRRARKPATEDWDDEPKPAPRRAKKPAEDDWGFDDEPAPAPRRAARQAAAPAPVESAPVDPFASMDFDFTKQNLSPSAPTSASAPAAKKDAFDDLFSL